MIKKLFLMAMLSFPLFYSGESNAQCANPTCISGAMIDLAEAKNIVWDPIDTHYDALDPAAACDSKPAIMTGARTYLWFSANKNGRWINGVDGFCILPGCTFKATINGAGMSSPRCE